MVGSAVEAFACKSGRRDGRDLLPIYPSSRPQNRFFGKCERIRPVSSFAVNYLAISVCTVLLVEACNIGLEPIVRPDVPALTKGRLSWVQQNYIRQETLQSANARLVDAQTQVGLAQMWGGGEVASADGYVLPFPYVQSMSDRTASILVSDAALPMTTLPPTSLLVFTAL